ncbi:VOC family protein [Neptunicoccus cionae]|uniref:VOC family protein n=1 Tax=Neptunicoccus cionae TaxID=2035344 RepID=UPI000C774D6C|nr:VOC family protein [Amylibacter cionae]PLS23201.1 VOC family protein [Amylibacter cionae]
MTQDTATNRHGDIVWSELHLRDMEAQKAFYSAVAGWTFDSKPLADGSGDYVVAMQDGRPIAGFLDMGTMPHLDGVPTHWLTYIGVEDVDKSVAAVVASGGTLHRPVFDIPDVGRVAVITDAGGAKLALMTQAS